MSAAECIRRRTTCHSRNRSSPCARTPNLSFAKRKAHSTRARSAVLARSSFIADIAVTCSACCTAALPVYLRGRRTRPAVVNSAPPGFGGGTSSCRILCASSRRVEMLVAPETERIRWGLTSLSGLVRRYTRLLYFMHSGHGIIGRVTGVTQNK